MSGSKKILVLAGCGVVAIAAVATVNHFSSGLKLDQAKAMYYQGITMFNDWSAKNAFAITAVNQSLEEVDDTQLHAITRFYHPDNQKSTSNCIDVATELTLTSGLFTGGEAATTHTTIVADPAKTDCRWISAIQENPQDKAIFDSVFQGQVPVELNGKHALSGASVWSLLTHAVQAKDIDTGDATKKLSLDIKPSELVFDMPETLDSAAYTFKWPGMQISGVDQKEVSVNLVVGRIDAHGEYTKITDNIWVGPGEFTLSQFHMAVPSDNQVNDIVIDGLKLTSTGQANEGKLAQSAQLSMADIRVNDQSFGQFEYAITTNNVDVARMDRLGVELQKAFPMHHSWDSDPSASPALSERQKESLVNAVIQALSQASFAIDPLAYSLGKGNISVSVAADFGDLQNVSFQSLQQNPAELANLVSVKFDGSVNDQLFEQIAAIKLLTPEQRNQVVVGARQAIDMGMQMGVLESKSAGVYELHASFDRGQVELNGQPIDPQMMQSLMSSK